MKIYISGPFFNDIERIRMANLKNYIKRNFQEDFCYFPIDLSIPNAEFLSNKIWSKMIFDEDVKQLDDADLMIVIYDGHYSDSGTAFEIGYALAKGIPIWILVADKTRDQSLMVTNATKFIWDFNTFIQCGPDPKLILNLGELNQT
jgi:nucleoside 2-deoxyribosyltransferase